MNRNVFIGILVIVFCFCIGFIIYIANIKESDQNEVEESVQNEVEESDQNEVEESDQNDVEESDQNEVEESDQNEVEESDQNDESDCNTFYTHTENQRFKENHRDSKSFIRLKDSQSFFDEQSMVKDCSLIDFINVEIVLNIC